MKVGLLFALAAASKLLNEDASLDMKDRPVAKVLKLLKDMQSELSAEAKSDQEQYEKMACWCENNRKGKGSAVDTASSRIEDLEHRIKALTAKASNLDSAIKELGDENASNTEALNTASAMRAKEAGEFHADETDLLTSIESLKAALTMLKKHQAFLQSGSSSVSSSVQTRLKKVVDDNDELINQILAPSARSALSAFVQASPHQSSSGEIFGVLEQMKENFEENLSGSQKDEAAAKEAFAELKAAKSDEIATGTAQYKAKSTLLAKTRDELAEAKEDHSDTSAALSADQVFLADLEKRCAAADADWEIRSKTRSQEVAAVSEAITILSNDEAHDTIGRSLGFVQLSRKSGREAASRILLAQAQKSHSAVLQALAASAKLDAFTKVQKAMDDMITDLKQQQVDEVEHKKFCKVELQKNDQDAFRAQNAINDQTTDIEGFSSDIDTLTDDIHQIDADLKEARVELQKANENRVAQNQEYQVVVADQRATQVILTKALDRLNKFYGFVQQEPGAAAPAPPEPMAEYKANAGAGSVLTMLGNVLTDAENMEKEATAGEQEAQDGYVAFAKNTFATIQAGQERMTSKRGEKGETEESKVGTESDRADTLAEAKGLSKYAGELHSQCDYVLANFDARQKARREELDALQAAKAELRTA